MNNKYVWRGKSAIIFNVRLNDLFEISDNDINLKDLYQGMTDLGYAFKSEKSTTWTYRSIKRFNVPTITSLNDLLSDELLQKDTAYYNRYAPLYGHIYPFKVLLKKDELPSTLKINIGRYYRIKGNETIDYQLEVSLLPDEVNSNDISSVSYVPFNFPSSVGEINLGEFKKGLEDAIEIMNMMTNLDYEFTPSIVETSNPQEAANSKMEFNIRFQDAWLDKNYVRSLVIHEIAHNFLNKNFPSTEELKQKVNTFMEFATGVDGATWQWLGNHNYPVIDGNNYSYIEDCLIAAACLLTKEGVPDVLPLEPTIPDTIDPEDDTTGTPSLDLRVVGISTDNHILLNTELNNTNIALSGAGSMVVHVKSEHTGGIVSSNCILIDNFGYFIERTDGYGRWPGGTTSSTTQKEITFSTVNTPKVNAKMTVMSTVDEDNHTLLRGDMCSKAIRVPAAGTSSSISVSKYPYDFASPLFFTPMVISPVYIDPITNEGSLGSYVEKTYSTDGFSATILEGNTVLDNIVSYSISTNNSNKYKEYILYIAPLYENYQIGEPYGYDGVMLHFIQEPLVKNRVYYGSGFSASKTFSDKNYNNPSGFEYHAFFETANSKILKKEFTLSVKEGNYCAWPNDGDYNMDFGDTQYNIVKVNYMWGNQSYTVARINSYMSNVQFKKKG